jgi:nucleoside 2-deoxyribosyltransferase
MEENIRRAERLSWEVWAMGAACICPHTNTRFFQNSLPDNIWLEGDLAMLERCDALIVTEDWEGSQGTRVEVDCAVSLGIPVFFSLDALREWLSGD